jgi:hypothetical protein
MARHRKPTRGALLLRATLVTLALFAVQLTDRRCAA